jgi:hypothetical protein
MKKLITLFGLSFGLMSCATIANDVEVFISDGSKQCFKISQSISTNEKKLTDANIDVKSSKCAVLTGTHFPAVCGGKTGRIHVFTISEQSLAEAESMGFTSVSSLRESMGYSDTACN